MLIRHGLIEEVGASVPLPADAAIIDGTGLTVYPGFIDALSTWGIPQPAPTITARSAAATAATPVGAQPPTPPATPTPAPPPDPLASTAAVHGPEERPQNYAYERAADLVTPADNRLDSARAAGFTTAATFPNRGILEGLGAIVDLAGARGRDMVVFQPVGEQIAFRTAAGGLGRSFPASLMGNIAYVRQLYLDLDQYKKAKQVYATSPAGNRRPEYDHSLEGLAEAPRLLLPANQEQQIDRMIDFGHELKVPFVLYGLDEGFKRVDRIKQANVPVIVSLKWPEKPRDTDPSEIPNYRDLVMRANAPSVPGLFAKAGIKFAFYSDGVDAALELKRNIRKAIDAGLPRAAAIRALTLTPAEIYGVSDRLGSIDKGKIANLVLIKGDAFDDKSSIEYLFIDGRQFRPSKELQQRAAPANAPGQAGGRPSPTAEPNPIEDHR